MNLEVIAELQQLGIDLDYHPDRKEFSLIIHNTKIFKECIENMRPKWIKYLESKGAEYIRSEIGTKNGIPIGSWVIKD